MIRIGIDVGGTFTKAVALHQETGDLCAHVAVPTTHAAQHGVAAGAVQALEALIRQTGIPPEEIRVVTFSTTQAVNALLEGDVVPVGILAIGPRAERRQTQQRTRLDQIKLAPGRTLTLHYTYLDREAVTPERVRAALESLSRSGARAVAISAAYAVEDPEPERLALAIAGDLGLPATAGHQLTGLYGLEVRTVTAAINASILPCMRKTTQWVRAALQEAGILAPAMILTGDLSVASIDQLAELPATSMLSGPAASVAGALREHPTVDALFVEVGGTSTNLGVIRDGRPVLRYVRIMQHPTCLRSVDVHVAGLGGGSLIRVAHRRIIGLGPRSAHIAGLPYVSFTSDLKPPFVLAFIAPLPGDTPDYVVVRDQNGRTAALTLTDAANALGLLAPHDYAFGDRERARAAFQPLADLLGRTVDETAQEVLARAVDALVPLARELMQDYELQQPHLIGLGGGAGVLAPALAKRLRLPLTIAHHAEVMAAIGATTTPLSVIEEVHLYSGAELQATIERLEHRLVALGADPRSVQVVVEPIPERHAARIRATALEEPSGSSTKIRISRAEALQLAAQALGVPSQCLELQFENEFYRVFTATVRRRIGPFRRERRPLAVIDSTGAICFRAADGWCHALRAPAELSLSALTGQCACAIIGSRCLLFDRSLPVQAPIATEELGCLLIGQPARV